MALKIGHRPLRLPNRGFEELVGTIKDVLKTDSRVKLAYVFGSWAEGRATDRSDIDVAVYVGDDLG